MSAAGPLFACLVRRLAVLLLFGAFLSAHAQGNLERRIAIEEAMRRANAWYQTTFPLGTAVWNRGAYHGGNLRAFQMLGIAADRDYSIAWAEANQWRVGPEAGGGADADSQACGQAYLDLYELDPQPVRKASIQAKMDALVASASADDDWWWIDAFYMAGPTFARLARLEANPAYFTQLEQMYAYMKSTHGLFDPARGLWYRDAAAKARTGANTPQFWGRGNGWVIAACARILEQLPAGDPRRAEFVSMLQTMAAALRPLQGADGFWRSNLLFPGHYPNPETSCTAFFAYAIAYGINEGLLDSATYTPVVERAWDGLVSLALNPAGRLGYVQAIGAAPGGATADSQQDYGYGAFLLAGCELLRMLGGPAPVSASAGPDLTQPDTDATYAEPVRLDASATVVRDAGTVGFTWWLGSIFLGEGETLDLTLPLGTHAITVKVEHAGGEIYSDARTVTVSPAAAFAPAVTAIGYQSPNSPANTLDRDLGTRWSQEGAGQWIQYQLPVTATLDHIGIAFYQGDSRRSFFSLQLSLDGTAWTTVFNGSSGGATLGLETFSFPAQAARFVRYIGNGNSTSAWNSLTEVDLPLARVLDAADADANSLPDSWEIHRLGAAGQNPAADPGGLGLSLRDAYIAGRDPLDPHADSPLRLEAGPDGLNLVLTPRAALGAGYLGKVRRYRVLVSDTLAPGSWQPVAGYDSVAGDNVPRTIPVTAGESSVFYRAETWLE